MYLFKFILITLVYSWGRAFEFGQPHYNYYNRFYPHRTQFHKLNLRQIDMLLARNCRPHCFISVAAAQGWHDPQFYPDYQNFDSGYHNTQQLHHQHHSQKNNADSSPYSTFATISQRKSNPHQQQQHQTQSQPQCECKRLKNCSNMLEQIYRSRISLSDWLLTNLPDPQCGFYANDAVVCCPKAAAPKRTTFRSTTEKPWVWEITRNNKRKGSNSNFEQGFERWDHTQFNKYNPITVAPHRVVEIKPHNQYSNHKHTDEEYQYNLIDFEDPDTHKNCPPSFNDEFEMPKPLAAPKRKTPSSNRKTTNFATSFQAVNKPPSRNRLNQDGESIVSSGVAPGQKINNRQPVKRFINSPVCGVSVNTRIVGGREISPGQFPWMARLAYRNRTSGKLTYRCAGSVISDRYILTAAHCVTNLVSSLEVFLVRVGDLDTNRNLDCEQNPVTCVVPQDYDIQKIIPHEKYDSPKYANDIALIKLVRPVNATQITPICLPVGELANADKKLTGKTGIIAGWGSKVADPTNRYTAIYENQYLPSYHPFIPDENDTYSLPVNLSDNNDFNLTSVFYGKDLQQVCPAPSQNGGVRQNPSLQYVLLPIVNRTRCATAYAQFSANSRTPIIVTDSQICAQGMENMDACQGDSGGPLMIEGTVTNARFTLLGLVSFGPRTCGVSNFPGVYSRVSSYINWIASNMD